MKTNAEIKSGLEALAASQGNQAVTDLISLLKEAVGSGQFLLKTGNGSTEGKVTTYPISDAQTVINGVIAAAYACPEEMTIKVKVGSDIITLSSIAAGETTLTGKLTVATGSYALSLSTTASSSTITFTTP